MSVERMHFEANKDSAGHLPWPDQTLFGRLRARALEDMHPVAREWAAKPVHAAELAKARLVLSRLVARFDEPEDNYRVEARLACKVQSGQYFCEAIVGDNTWDDVRSLAMGADAARSVARLHIRHPDGATAFATGVLVGKGLFLTTRSVLQNRAVARRSLIVMNHELGTDGSPVVPIYFRVRGDVFLSSDRLDYAIVDVDEKGCDGTGLSTFGHLPMMPRSGKLLKGELANLIQHPCGDWKKLSMRENIVVGRDEGFLYHVSDTRPAAIGAPVFNEDWQFAALNHLEIPAGETTGKSCANRAIRVSSILADISQRASEGCKDAGRIEKRLHRIAQEREFEDPVGLCGGSDAARHVLSPAPRPRPQRRAKKHKEGSIVNPAGRVPMATDTSPDGEWTESAPSSPDTWHLPRQFAESAFELTADVLVGMTQTSRMTPHAGPDGNIIFALRGTRFADGAQSVERQPSLFLQNIEVNFESDCCILGIWHQDSGLLSAFVGSTVPRKTVMKQFFQDVDFGSSAGQSNILPTGCYQYCVGTHFDKDAGAVKFVLRQGHGPMPADAGTVTVQRTTDAEVYGAKAVWQTTREGINIHPGALDGVASSAAGLTLPGSQDGHGSEHVTATGSWADFRRVAGFDGKNYGARYDLLLFTGHEAATFAHVEDPFLRKSFMCLRHGSSGEAVGQIQIAIGAYVDGHFGADTKKCLTEHQMTVLGYATGTLSPAMANWLSVDI